MNYLRLCALTTALAFVVIVLGAYVRLSDAGLSCPDWPGCYGQLAVPQSVEAVVAANSAYPQRPLDASRAWKEMTHRYLAGGLGLLILALALMAWRESAMGTGQRRLAWVIVGLVIVQALLGRWTVTALLQPVSVLAHLLGGMTILGLLWWQWLTQRHGQTVAKPVTVTTRRRRALFASLVLGALVFQLALGAWTSANYAAVVCPEFPTCQASWWPAMDFSGGFTLLPAATGSYEGGVHSLEARTAIHVTHRIGALIVSAMILGLSTVVWSASKRRQERVLALVLLLALGIQITLGVANAIYARPLFLAVAHNGMAGVLLLSVVTSLHRFSGANH